MRTTQSPFSCKEPSLFPISAPIAVSALSCVPLTCRAPCPDPRNRVGLELGRHGFTPTLLIGSPSPLGTSRSMVTNQDELDVEWPDPMARAKWRWSYPPDWAPDVVRYVRYAARPALFSPLLISLVPSSAKELCGRVGTCLSLSSSHRVYLRICTFFHRVLLADISHRVR